MFILRKIHNTKGIETNISLGNSYDLVTMEHNPEEYKRISLELYDQVEPIVYGFIVYENGAKILDLCCHYKNYIMTSSGEVFSDETLK